MNRIRHLLLDNIGLKIIAIVISAILWLLITSINDPITYKDFNNVTVHLLNTDLITDEGQVYSVLDSTDIIPTVTIAAPRSVVDALGRENIQATADITNLSSLNTVEIRLTTNVYSNKIESIKGSIDNVKLSIDNRQTKTFTLQTSTGGEPAAGFILSEVTTEQNQVRVSGGEQTVSRIARAIATVDVSGATNTVNTYVDIKLYDEEGEEIPTDSLTMNITSVKMTAVILATKEVPIVVQTQGTPMEGYVENGINTTEPAFITLAGRTSVLAGIDSLTIPADQMDVTGAFADITRTVEITDYLPENTRFADSSFSGSVTVTVGIEPEKQKTFEISPTNVALENIPEGYECSVVETAQPAVLRVSGLGSALDKITTEELQPRVDVGTMIENMDETEITGDHSATVAYTLPSGISQMGASTVKVVITKKEDSAE